MRGACSMPPKVKITREAIVEASLQIVREDGLEKLNARELAKRLKCSTQPVFRVFSCMDELKQAVYNKAEEIFNSYMVKGMNNEVPTLGVGLAYIGFAKKEKNLFKLLFMTDYFKSKSFAEIIEKQENESIIQMMVDNSELSIEYAEKLYLDLWLISHGIASLLVNNAGTFTQLDITETLTDAYYGIKEKLKEKEKI